MTHIKQVLERFRKQFHDYEMEDPRNVMIEDPSGEIEDFILSSHTSYLEKQIEWVKGETRKGLHEFPIGTNVCNFCGLPRKGVYPIRSNIVLDEKSGGSSVEVTRMEFDITGEYCDKNDPLQYNSALQLVVDHLQEELSEIKKL